MAGYPFGNVALLSNGPDGHAGAKENEEGQIDLAQLFFSGQVHARQKTGHSDQGKNKRARQMVLGLQHKPQKT